MSVPQTAGARRTSSTWIFGTGGLVVGLGVVACFVGSALALGVVVPPEFAVPRSEAFDAVNALIGNGGDTPNGSGGMIPSTAPPFGMTRWVAQTHRNFVSRTPYNWTSERIHGFQGTRQPAIWMGESAPVGVVPGFVEVGVDEDGGARGVPSVDFEERGMKKVPGTEVITPSYYRVELEDDRKGRGRVVVEQSATSRVGHLRFTFRPSSPSFVPSVLVEVSRPSVITSDETNVTFPHGQVFISPHHGDPVTGPHTALLEISGFNDERQDSIITPTSIAEHAAKFKGYFSAQFTSSSSSTPSSSSAILHSFGILKNGTNLLGTNANSGALLSAYALFSGQGNGTEKADSEVVLEIRVGTSFISDEAARGHISNEAPLSGTLEQTARTVREAWVEKLDRIQIEGATQEQKEVFYTSLFHALQYPNEQIENGKYWSGYDGHVHEAEESYTGYSIWDTYRAAWAWQILFSPERIPGMITSMLADFKEGGWLPMWKNVVETNIMVGTHADSLIAEAVVKGLNGFDRELAWEAVWKDATVAPENDWTTNYYDREENVDYEVRAGLTSVYGVDGQGWVADDVHSESASRTLDYAYDDYAAAQLAKTLGKSEEEIVNPLMARAMRTAFTLWNEETGFMEARNADGSWAGDDAGWTEGDKWAYSFDVVHDIPGLIERRGGNASFVKSLDEHFDAGHNDHTNEPSHHIPYLYSLAGAAYKTQERVREIARNDYNNTPVGLSGNEDCGQMSAWYIFSAMGFYPVSPASGEYVVGSPFFDRLVINLPPRPAETSAGNAGTTGEGEADRRVLTITARGAPTKLYIKSLTVNGEAVTWPVIRHDQIADGGEIVFEMSDNIEAWGNGLLLLQEQSQVEHVEL
ncbi:glycoside hydrolase family 92 protein [Amanita thiersii Skay4041]|uniref:Glycoside hydrolase family 92 protein n=1 Tax=Amanita thiersii Skay4041 TaxID=703135 RepID=A0A2A9NAL1_9AGAR|nr:glycoside hydrolase family 92 protein [Amanita thiersii Skay4041]